MSDKNNSLDLKVVFLVNNGFDELETTQCMHIFRQAGLEVEILGHKAGLIKGVNGLTIQPDRTLVEVEEPDILRLIVLPSTVHSVMSMLVDPRVHRLLGSVTAGIGQVALMDQAEEAFIRAGFDDILNDPKVVCQGQNDLTIFGRYLATLLDAE